MKQFDFQTLNSLQMSPTMVNMLTQIYEFRGRLTAIEAKRPAMLRKLTTLAKIQSTDASNRIEGIFTSNVRLKQLMAEKTTPRNRSEAEISGYRNVLNLIHESYTDIPLNPSTILTLHEHLFRFTADPSGGHFKQIDNQIIETAADGTKMLRFQPPAAYLTPSLIEQLCLEYTKAVNAMEMPPLLVCGAFIFDFVSIHPFRDGNGRMSRLLMLLTLYKAGFSVGQYLSLEKLIEQTKDAYYASLQESSVGWEKNDNRYEPFLNYFLSIVLQGYRDLAERTTMPENDYLAIEPKRNQLQRLPADQLITRALQYELVPTTKSTLVELVPQYSQKTIERSLSQMVSDGLVKQKGKSRATTYQLKQ